MAGERSTGRGAKSQAEDSLRLCVASRVSRDPADLIRFVAGPDGIIVADLSRRLPGRGVWVTADRSSIDRAVATRAFAKSLKRRVEAPADLSARVERLLERRVSDAFSLANKAGAVLTGFEKIDRQLVAGGVGALIHGTDAAADGRDKLDRKFTAIEGSEAVTGRMFAILTVEQMSLAIGRPNVVHAALIKGGATDRFLVEAGRLARFRLGIGHSNGCFDEPRQTAENGRLNG